MTYGSCGGHTGASLGNTGVPPLSESPPYSHESAAAQSLAKSLTADHLARVARDETWYCASLCEYKCTQARVQTGRQDLRQLRHYIPGRPDRAAAALLLLGLP